MTFIANCLSALVVFAVGWLAIAQFDAQTGRAGIYAFAVAAVTFAMGLYDWQPGGKLASIEFRDIASYFAAVAIGLSFFLLVDAFEAEVNLIDPSQWHNLSRARGPFGFGLTAVMALFMLALLLATLVRVFMLKVLEDLPSRSKRRAS